MFAIPDDETLANFANLAGAASAPSGHSMINNNFQLWCVASHVAWPFCILSNDLQGFSFPQLVAWHGFFHYAVRFAASVTQKWHKNWPSIFSIPNMHSWEDSLFQCSLNMSRVFFFFTGPQNEVISHAYFRYRYRHLSYGKRPMFLASPHWCGHALSNWEQNTWFEVHETRVSQESARCCSASVISIFLCFCFLLPGYWYIWTWSLLKVCSQMIPDESCICSTIRSWRPWKMPVTWCSLWGRLRSSGTRPFAATKTCTEEIRRRLCSISEGSWILLPSYFKGCW